MKNKKLFAILTLVCFMMTLMPVAAFAADYGYVEDQYSVVKTMDTVRVDFTTSGSYYVYATKDGALVDLRTTGATLTTGYDVMGINIAKAATTTFAELKFARPGEYKIGVAPVTTALNTVIEIAGTLVSPATVLSYLESFAIDMLDSTVVVNAARSDYTIAVPATTSVAATNGFNKALVTATLTNTNGGAAIPNADLEIVTDSHAIDVIKVDSKTRANGTMRFYVTGSIPGTYTVYVNHPAAITQTVTVTVNPATIDEVTTVSEPSAPKELGVASTATGIVFKITDATGYAYTTTGVGGVTTADYSVTVLEAPKGFNKNQTFALEYTTGAVNGWKITDGTDTLTGVALGVEGKYTFQVSLANGSKAVASVEVAEFDKAVALKFDNTVPKTAAYDVNFNVTTSQVVAVDAKGVEKAMNGVTLTVNGKNVTSYTTGSGLVTVVGNEDYVGSTITVLANLNNKLVATHEIVVTEHASTIVYDSTEVPVGANKVLAGKVYDEAGKFVAASGNANVVVLAKPENAVASVSVANGGSVANGKFGVNFLANVAGEYKIQTIVVDPLTSRHFTEVTTITVGVAEGSFKDVIVLSIGSNNMIKNGEVGSLLAAPEIKDGRTMIPMRAGLEAFGAKVDWNEADRSIKAEMNGVTVVMTLDSLTYTVNGKVMTADAAPYIKNGSTMVPAVFFTKAFGITATPLYDANGVCDVLFSK